MADGRPLCLAAGGYCVQNPDSYVGMQSHKHYLILFSVLSRVIPSDFRTFVFRMRLIMTVFEA